MQKKFVLSFVWLLLTCIPMSHAASAVPAAPASKAGTTERLLVDAYLKARRNDPEFRSAIAEYKGNIIDSRVAGTAYYPQMSVSSSQIANESGDQRYTAAVIQPILSVDRYATLQEEEPREAIAKTTFKKRETELAIRLFELFARVALAYDRLLQNEARISSLKQQYEAGKRIFELGQGTVTDMTDAKVKMLQAESDNIKLQNLLYVAKEEYSSIIGEMPVMISIRDIPPGNIDTEGPAEHWIETSNDVLIAGLNKRLGELGVTRAKSAWVPELSASYTYTNLGGESDTFLGFSLNMPIRADNYYGVQSARSELEMLQEKSLNTHREVRLEIQNLQLAVKSGIIQLRTLKEAVTAADLSVKSNEQSYKGGVRNLLDVLTSIDILYTIKGDYAVVALELGKSLLRLRMQQGQPIVSALEEVERLVKKNP